MTADLRTVVIAGGSCAGMSAARELRKLGFDGDLVVFDRELGEPYRRPEVSKGLLSGAHNRASIRTPWPAQLCAQQVRGAELTGLDADRREVRFIDGSGDARAQRFDGLVIATGCSARPSPFGSVRGVHTLRTRTDSEAMRPDLLAADHVVVIGAGFIGLEVASVARSLGKQVSVVENADVPLLRALGADIGERVATMHRARGVDLRTGTTVTELQSRADGAVRSAVLADGSELIADVVLVALGSTPNTAWLAATGWDLSDGVNCDSSCAVEGQTDMVAAGDVASWVNVQYGRRMRVEHWTNAIEQGAAAARRLLGVSDDDGFRSVPYFWSDQCGVRIQSIGSAWGHDDVAVLPGTGDHLLAAYLTAGRVVGVVGIDAGPRVMRTRPAVARGGSLDEVAALVGA